MNAQNRPQIVFKDSNISELKSQLNTNTTVKDAYISVRSKANDVLKEDFPYEKLDYLALMYLMEKSEKMRSKIINTIIRLSEYGSLEPVDMLHRQPAWRSQLATAKANYNMAVAFDAIYPDISDELRHKLAECIYKVGIEPTIHDWLDPDTRHHTVNSMGHNYWMACIGNCAIACMAIAKEMPEMKYWIEASERAVDEWVGFEGDMYQNKPKTIDNGAYYESVNYANYGMSQYLLYRYAKGNYYGGEHRVSDNDRMIAEYFMHACYPVLNGKMPSLYFGDGDEYSNGEMCVKLLYEMGLRDNNMLWYLSKITPHQHCEGLPLDSPLGLLISPSLKDAPALPNISTNIAYLANGWASLRDSWMDDSSLLAVKCGHTWNHAHADAGSFVIYHHGHPVIKDAGNCWYPNEQYRNYFFQSDAHNVLMLDGKAQPVEQQYQGSYCDGKISEVTEGHNIRYLTADVTGPTSKFFYRNMRSFLWIDNVILIIDDARSYYYGEYSWCLHPGMLSKKKGIDIMINNGADEVAVRPLWPEYLTESDFEHDFPFNLKLTSHQAPKAKNLSETETYYTISDPQKRNNQKFVTAIILPDSCGFRPEVTRVDMVDGYGVRIKDKHAITDVYINKRADGHIMHRNSCNTLGIFDTDAYILSYTYPEKSVYGNSDISRCLMVYGSYVRNGSGGDSVFDAYTKQTKIFTPSQK